MLKYFFSRNPGQAFEYYTEFIILIAVLFIASIAFSQIYKKRKKHNFAFKRLFSKTANRLFLIGLMLTILILLRYENIPYFSMRILLYLGLLLLLYFIFKTIKIYKIDYPREKQNVQSRPVKQDKPAYLPNKK